MDSSFGGLQELSDRAGAALVSGRTEEAVELSQQVLEWMDVLDDASPSLAPLNHYRLSVVWSRLGDLEGAIVHGGEAFSMIDHTPNRSLRLKILDNLADLSIRVGHHRRAIAALETAIALGEETGADWIEQTTRLCRIAETYLQTGLPRHAASALTTCTHLAEGALGGDALQLAYICLLHCRAQVESGGWEDALRLGTRAHDLNSTGEALPEDCEAELESLLGGAYLGLGKLEEARWHFEVALEKTRREPEVAPEEIAVALARLAECRIEAGALDVGEATLSEAVDLLETDLPEPEPYTDVVVLMRRAARRAEVWMAYARLAEAQQDIDKALEALRLAKASMHITPVPNLRNATKLFNREARLHRSKGDLEAAAMREAQARQVESILAQVPLPRELTDLRALDQIEVEEDVVEVGKQRLA